MAVLAWGLHTFSLPSGLGMILISYLNGETEMKSKPHITNVSAVQFVESINTGYTQRYTCVFLRKLAQKLGAGYCEVTKDITLKNGHVVKCENPKDAGVYLEKTLNSYFDLGLLN